MSLWDTIFGFIKKTLGIFCSRNIMISLLIYLLQGYLNNLIFFTQYIIIKKVLLLLQDISKIVKVILINKINI